MARVQVPAEEQVAPGIENQPVGNVEWVPRSTLHANDYNPNRVAPIELRLLKRSILEDGWTQPIVVRAGGEIVDGFHRWTVSAEPELMALTDGMVPVVRLRDGVSESHQRMSTIRHNRARGKHVVANMADIVADLVADGTLDEKTARERLGMEPEEVRRLRDRGDILNRGSDPDEKFNPAWIPDW